MLEGIYRSAADAREVSLHSELGAAR
jgi:hypothetical protein